ncbi:oxygenase MpaB family protein [Nocardia takedensis]|uniref:oxygenase MpaB family protein n=1 Tax=Nocardia takedensis TaxID=259390 RepID=UPI0002D35463|nr:oxygenase MpaB family protein [Nocardia takedensis]
MTHANNRIRGAQVRARIAALDPRRDADEIARLSLTVLHGHGALVYALFTVAFLEQVAVPAMARTLYRRGTGDIVRDTLRRNDDTIVFFGNLLDHGPDSAVGRAWIERLNQIHAHFPLRAQDSLYTLATLALDPHAITTSLGVRLFSEAEQEAHWRFWRAVAVRQHLVDIPDERAELARWALAYEQREYAASDDGRAIARALIDAFGQRCLPRAARSAATRVIATFCSRPLRRVHGLPDPDLATRALVGAGLRAYAASVDFQRLDPHRSLAVDFGERRYGPRTPDEVGYHHGGRVRLDRPEGNQDAKPGQ